MKKSSEQTIRLLTYNEDKILNIIASCEDGQHLLVVKEWLNRIMRNESEVFHDLIMKPFKSAIESRYYRLIQEFNTRKSYSRNEPIEKYTEYKQRFYCKNIERK